MHREARITAENALCPVLPARNTLQGADLIEEKFPKLDGKVRIDSIGTADRFPYRTGNRGAVLLGRRENPLNEKAIPKNTCTLSESVIDF